MAPFRFQVFFFLSVLTYLPKRVPPKLQLVWFLRQSVRFFRATYSMLLGHAFCEQLQWPDVRFQSTGERQDSIKTEQEI